ncbi:GFA family protein [Pseudorhizobium endolithicum]
MRGLCISAPLAVHREASAAARVCAKQPQLRCRCKPFRWKWRWSGGGGGRTGQKSVGGCLRGRIRYHQDGWPMFFHCCHCRDCRRQNGSASGGGAPIPAARD